MRLDIDSLRAFRTVIELGGVTRAAQRLNLTQSAISHKLSRLEDRIGRPILSKENGRLSITEDGQQLLTYAIRLVELHDEAADRFRPSNLAGSVRLGATEETIDLAAVLGRFRRMHPKVTLSIKIAQSSVLQQLLKSGDIDLAVIQVFSNEIQSDDIEMWRDDLIWATSSDHPVGLDSVVPFISFDETCFYRRAAREALAMQGRTLVVALECPSLSGVVAGIRCGLGIGLLGRRYLAPGIAEIKAGLPIFPQTCHLVRLRHGIEFDLASSLVEVVTRNAHDVRPDSYDINLSRGKSDLGLALDCRALSS